MFFTINQTKRLGKYFTFSHTWNKFSTIAKRSLLVPAEALSPPPSHLSLLCQECMLWHQPCTRDQLSSVLPSIVVHSESLELPSGLHTLVINERRSFIKQSLGLKMALLSNRCFVSVIKLPQCSFFQLQWIRGHQPCKFMPNWSYSTTRKPQGFPPRLA